MESSSARGLEEVVVTGAGLAMRQIIGFAAVRHLSHSPLAGGVAIILGSAEIRLR